MKPLYSGEGLPGRLLNSPWNCEAKKKYLFGNSKVSILLPSELLPEKHKPFFFRTSM